MTRPILLFCACLLSASGWAMESVSILENGGFEQGENTPQSWKANGEAVGAVFLLDDRAPHQGRFSGRITTETTEKRGWPAYEQEFTDIKPGERYAGEAWVRTALSDAKSSAYLAMEYLGADGKRIAYDKSEGLTGNGFPGSIQRVRGTLPPGTTVLRFRMILHGPGTAWFDSVKLSRVENWKPRPILQAARVALQPTGKVVQEAFGGFGAQIDSYLWNENNRSKGVDEADLALFEKRVREMALPLARMQLHWSAFNPSGDRSTITWESDGAKALLGALALCQRNGIEVTLTVAEWKHRPYGDLTAAAKVSAEVLEHLYKARGFTCIKWWQVWNEPDCTWVSRGWTFPGYLEIHDRVAREFKARGLPVGLMVADTSVNPGWFAETVKGSSALAGGYAFHHYTAHDDPGEGAERTEDLMALAKTLDPDWHKKKFFLAEFGLNGPKTKNTVADYYRTFDCGLGIAVQCMDAASAGVHMASIWTLQSEYYPGMNFMPWGLLEFKDLNWKPRPVWFAYSLFSRFMARGSRLSEVRAEAGENLVKAIQVDGPAGRFLFVVNQSHGEVTFDFPVADGKGQWIRRNYDETIMTNLEDRSLFMPGAAVAHPGRVIDRLAARSLAVYELK